uniref:Uncharacterized protein n=1 Tax=Molossus molossus TaxID=27622 RepID=A0A7J8BYD2_MOLMO|nr:hypothetical protein HJG59_010020 [Molossus molossus]
MKKGGGLKGMHAKEASVNRKGQRASQGGQWQSQPLLSRKGSVPPGSIHLLVSVSEAIWVDDGATGRYNIFEQGNVVPLCLILPHSSLRTPTHKTFFSHHFLPKVSLAPLSPKGSRHSLLCLCLFPSTDVLPAMSQLGDLTYLTSLIKRKHLCASHKGQ